VRIAAAAGSAYVGRVESNGRDLEFEIPSELEGGVYANALGTWHSPHEFTLDFGVMHGPEPVDEVDPASDVACRVIARLRIPVTLMFAFIRDMNESLTDYEQRYGEIRKPGGAMTRPFYISVARTTVRPEDVPVLRTPGIVYKREPTGFRRYKALFAPPRKKRRRPGR
jgi:Protein of unknown function (DUF3467)